MRRNIPLFALIAALTLGYTGTDATAQPNADRKRPNPLLEAADRNTATPGVSPTRRIERRPPSEPNAEPLDATYRSIDGTANNLADTFMGAADEPLLRLLPPAYADGVQTLAGEGRPSPRLISNVVVAQPAPIPNTARASDFIWQWGQFLDHDIDLTDGADPPEPVDIDVPIGDPHFDPTGSGTAVIAFNRSIYDPATGDGNSREQLNEITSWIDASNVYGSDTERAEALRRNDGTGRLRTSRGKLLPFNTTGLPNAGGNGPSLFLAGDVRANEQVALTAMHTLFVREHNRQANKIRRAQPGLSGDEIYERAREIVGAEMQAITYREYLPALLGRGTIAPYRGYKPEVDARIANVFSAASFRWGHSALSPVLRRLNPRGRTIAAGDLALRDAFFAPQRILEEGGIEPLLRGLASQVSQRIDIYVIDDVRNFLFGPPGAGGFDLAALNIQRGRDHGLPPYNEVRDAYGLTRAETFADVTSNTEVQDTLAQVYGSVDDIDVWLGGLAEDPKPGALVGELIAAVLKEQFEALRDGDRYWYERKLAPAVRRQVRKTRLADIIRRNTKIGREISRDVFHVPRSRRRTR